MRKDLSYAQMEYIKLCCTYFTDPMVNQRKEYTLLLNELGRNKTIPEISITFARKYLFCELDPILIRYHGYRLKNPSKNKFETISFYLSCGEYILVPMALGNLLMNKNHNANLDYPSSSFKFTGELRQHQKELIPKFIEHLTNCGSTTVGLYPGAGKTVIGAYLSAHLNKITIVFIHRTLLISQWVNTFTDHTNAKIWVVGMQKPESFDVIICMDERMKHIPVDVLSKIGTVIIDEAHCFCVKSRMNCWFLQPRYLILLTATLNRPDDGMEKMALSSAGNWNVTIKSQKPFNVYPIFTNISADIERNSAGTTDWNKFCNFLFTNEYRNKIVLDLIYQLYSNNKFLILTSRNSHVDLLKDILGKKKLPVSSFHGNDKEYSDSKILIGTIPKIGTGFDEVSFCKTFNGQRFNILILCITIKKLTTFEQVLGRILRSDCPETYILIDEGIPKTHWTTAKWWFANYTHATIIENFKLKSSVSITTKYQNPDDLLLTKEGITDKESYISWMYSHHPDDGHDLELFQRIVSIVKSKNW